MDELRKIPGIMVIREIPRWRGIFRYAVLFLMAHGVFSLLLYLATGHMEIVTLLMLDMLAGAAYAAVDRLWLVIPRYEIRQSESYDDGIGGEILRQNYYVKPKRNSQMLLVVRPRRKDTRHEEQPER